MYLSGSPDRSFGVGSASLGSGIGDATTKCPLQMTAADRKHMVDEFRNFAFGG